MHSISISIWRYVVCTLYSKLTVEHLKSQSPENQTPPRWCQEERPLREQMDPRHRDRDTETAAPCLSYKRVTDFWKTTIATSDNCIVYLQTQHTASDDSLGNNQIYVGKIRVNPQSENSEKNLQDAATRRDELQDTKRVVVLIAQLKCEFQIRQHSHTEA